jgi:hypothetical protein
MWRSSAAQHCQGLKQVTSPTGPHPTNTPSRSTTTPSRTTTEPSRTRHTHHAVHLTSALFLKLHSTGHANNAPCNCQQCHTSLHLTTTLRSNFPPTPRLISWRNALSLLWPAASPNIHPQRPLLSPLFPILTRRFNSISTIALPFSVVLLLLARLLSS